MTETALDWKQEQRTFALGAADGVLVRMYNSLIDPSLVLTWFVTQLSSSLLAVALLLPLARGGYMLPQLFACSFVQRQPRKIPLYRVASALSVLALGAATALVFVLGARQPVLLLVSFLVLYFLCYLSMGIAGVLMASAFSLSAQIEERVEPVPTTGMAASINLASMLGILRRDRNFALYVAARVTLTLHTIALPFYTVFAKERLGAPVEMASVYLGAYTGATLLSSLIWGRIGDRCGNRVVLLASAILGLPCPLLLGGRLAYSQLLPLFALLGLTEGGIHVAVMSFVLDLAPPAQRTIYVGLTNTTMGFTNLALIRDPRIARVTVA